ncbi:MAG TPA: hypothetical protein VEH04_17090 [Verrucomicrobiae bacterium]|nr:hypothetical protein [Verrucomicrobiae bacterium]
MSDQKVKTLRVKIEDRPAIEVSREAYVKAKTKQLREFGYGTLTEQHVDEQVDAVLSNKEIGAGLTVIGAFMQGEVLGQGRE